MSKTVPGVTVCDNNFDTTPSVLGRSPRHFLPVCKRLRLSAISVIFFLRWISSWKRRTPFRIVWDGRIRDIRTKDSAVLIKRLQVTMALKRLGRYYCFWRRAIIVLGNVLHLYSRIHHFIILQSRGWDASPGPVVKCKEIRGVGLRRNH